MPGHRARQGPDPTPSEARSRLEVTCMLVGGVATRADGQVAAPGLGGDPVQQGHYLASTPCPSVHPASHHRQRDRAGEVLAQNWRYFCGLCAD